MYILIIFSVLVFLPLPLMALTSQKTGNAYKAIFQAVIGVAIAMMLIFILASFSGNPVGHIIAAELQSFCETVANNNQIVTMLGMDKLSFDERINELVKIYTYAINALPATLLVWATIIAYFEYMFISRINKKAKYPLPDLPKVKDFSLPKKALWGWVLIYLMTLFFILIGFVESNILQINIQVLFQFVFQIQGIAVIFYFCDYKKWSKVVTIILCLVFLPTIIGQMLLCTMGFLDLGFGLRKIITRH